MTLSLVVANLPEITVTVSHVAAALQRAKVLRGRHVSYPAVVAFGRAVVCSVHFDGFDVLTPLIVAHLKETD